MYDECGPSIQTNVVTQLNMLQTTPPDIELQLGVSKMRFLDIEAEC